MVVNTRAGDATSIPGELGDGTAADTFPVRLLAHNRPPVEVEVPRGMTLGELARHEGLEAWYEVSAINAAGLRLRAGNILKPTDDPIVITGRLSGAAA